MNLIEVVKEALKKDETIHFIRRKSWEDKEKVVRFEHNYKDKDCMYPLLYIVMPHGSYVYALLVDDLLADDWEIYEDEKTFDVV
jgi:hypothetical protein